VVHSACAGRLLKVPDIYRTFYTLMYYFCIYFFTTMGTHSISHGTLERSEHEKWPVSKWMKFLSITLFSEAAILFFLSFIIFFIKRTEGTDPRLISGSFEGTTQLTFFITVNLLSAILAVQGYYLFFFNNESEIRDDHLRKFFKTAGLTSIPVFLVFTGILLFRVFGQ